MTQETSIHVHQAIDGQPFCSYDVPYTHLDLLDTPDDSYLSTLEYIENMLYQEEGSSQLIEEVPDEYERTGEPPQIGYLTYNDEEILDIEFDFDHLLGDTHG